MNPIFVSLWGLVLNLTEEIQLHPYVYMNSTAQVCYCQVWQPWCFPNLKLEYLTNTLQLLYRDYRDYMKRPHMQLYISWLGHYLSRLCSTWDSCLSSQWSATFQTTPWTFMQNMYLPSPHQVLSLGSCKWGIFVENTASHIHWSFWNIHQTESNSRK